MPAFILYGVHSEKRMVFATDIQRSYYETIRRRFSTSKSFHLIKKFLNSFLLVSLLGLLELWYNQVEHAIITYRRFHRMSRSDEAIAFTLVDMQTAFYICIIGQLICCCVFIIELIVFRHKKRNQFQS